MYVIRQTAEAVFSREFKIEAVRMILGGAAWRPERASQFQWLTGLAAVVGRHSILIAGLQLLRVVLQPTEVTISAHE